MDNSVTVFAVLFMLTVLCSAAAAVLLFENRRLRKENKLFRRLWNEQMAMKSSCFNAYAEMFRRTGQAAGRSYPPENGR